MNQNLYDFLSEKRQGEIDIKNYILENTAIGDYTEAVKQQLIGHYVWIDAYSQEISKAAGIKA